MWWISWGTRLFEIYWEYDVTSWWRHTKECKENETITLYGMYDIKRLDPKHIKNVYKETLRWRTLHQGNYGGNGN